MDYPEAENLNQYNQPDIFRLHTAGAKLQNKVLSTETGGTSAVYGTSWQELLDDIYVQYAMGFQRVIWHIWTSDYGYGNYAWPGYMSGFGGGMAFNRWGSREPASRDYDEFNAHIGRVQQLVREGKSRTDVGFVYNSWTQGMKSGGEDGSFSENSMNWKFAHQGVIYRSTELQDNGYTYDYFSPDFLFNEDVYYNKETGTLENAGYRALVIFQEMLSYDGAEKILELAKQGLPVVIVGSKAATLTTFNDGKDEDLAKIMEEMKALPNVRTAQILDNEVAVDAMRPEISMMRFIQSFTMSLVSVPMRNLRRQTSSFSQIRGKMKKETDICMFTITVTEAIMSTAKRKKSRKTSTEQTSRQRSRWMEPIFHTALMPGQAMR